MSDLPRIFISHATPDTAFAERLATDLRRAGADVWLDATHLAGTGGDFIARISAALDSRDVLILILSPAALASKWVPLEMNASIVRYVDDAMRAPIVVVKDHVESKQIPGMWVAYNRIDAAQLGYDKALPLIYTALGILPPPPPQATASRVVAETNPIKPPMTEQATPATTPTRGGSPRQPAPALPKNASPYRSTVNRWRKVALLLVMITVVAVGAFTAYNFFVNHPGSLDWEYQTGGFVGSSPTAVNGIVYVGSEDGSVYALHA